MAEYRVVIECHDLYEKFIEADSEDEALELAQDLMGEGDWGQLIEGASQVDIYSIKPHGTNQ